MRFTEIVSKWMSGAYPNYGFLLMDNNESDPDHWTTLCSSDADSPHKPELHIEYSCETINLQVIYDNAYGQRFSNPSSRILNCLNVLQEKYFLDFGITVNFSSPVNFISYADLYCTTDYNALCTHANSSACTNSEIHDDGSITIASLHHTNIYNILARVGVPASSTTAKFTYLGRKLCACTGSNCMEIEYYGLTLEPIRVVAVRNCESTEQEIATTIHELGHLYGVIDHYGGVNSTETTLTMQGRYPNRGYDSLCIYGEGKFDYPYITNDVVICDGCKSWIAENRTKFSS